VFATERGPDGPTPAADPLLLTGVVFGALGAAKEPQRWYHELTAAPEYAAPVAWSTIEPAAFDGLVLPGGHAPGMRQYLGSEVLQAKVAQFWGTGKPVGAICHGVLVLARARTADGRSPLHDVRTTCLPKYMERSAFLVSAWRRGRYYRTYPAYVEEEVRAALREPETEGQPRFRPLQDWGQLTGIEGFDRDFLERDADGLRRRARPADLLTVAPLDVLRPMPVNLNTASDEVLSGLFGRERPDIVRSVQALREAAPLRSVVPLARRMDPVAFTRLAPWISVHSTVFRVTVRAADDRGERAVSALAHRDLDGRVRILEWAEQ